jgi:hypothetical protein
MPESSATANKTVDSLPKRSSIASFGTERWIKITNTPPAWGDKLLQADVYAWDEKEKTWEKTPIATTDRTVWGQGKTFQHTLNLLAEKGSERARGFTKKSGLPRGKYLVEVYVDAEGRLANNWNLALGEADYVGRADITSGWPEGYGAMTFIDAAGILK